MPRIIHLRCSCCGGDAPALKQWWNQDTGYGICKRCFKSCLARYEYHTGYTEETYGKPRIHHSLEGDMRADVFYDRMTRTWICRIVDDEGNQVGDCDYEPTKALAKATAEKMLQERTATT